MGLPLSASCECGAASQTTWTRWDCCHQHRVSAALQARPHEPDGTVTISIVWVRRCKPDHMNLMGLSPSASCECGAASQTTWTRWDCHHQHRVSAALQARPHEPDGTVTISIVWVRRCKPERTTHRQRMSSTQLQWGLGHIEHCRLVTLNTAAWSHWTLPHVTCLVCHIEDFSNKCKKKKYSYLVGTTHVQTMYHIDEALQNKILQQDEVWMLPRVITRWRCRSCRSNQQRFQQDIERCWTHSLQRIFLEVKHSTNYENSNVIG